MRVSLSFLFILLSFLTSHSFGQDSNPVLETDTIILKEHSAKRATILSTVAPGAGQIYNKKAWKAPIVWAGMATCVYFISNNRSAFKIYKKESILRESPDYVSSFTYSDSPYANYLKNPPNTVMTDPDLSERLDIRKTWLDLSYFSLIIVYGLNILDANVDGHLFNYDISPDISMKMTPSYSFSRNPSAGLSLTLNF